MIMIQIPHTPGQITHIIDMPVNNSGKIIRPRRFNRGTAHQKNHRWESFSTKISKLHSLNPIRRVRRHVIETEEISTSNSYLKTGLEKWAELNISEGFTSFHHEVVPMCDSLPQIVHFEDKIVENFVLYIEKQEVESLEPLLELITDFAHDLGYRFEKHFSKVLSLIISLVASHQDVAVIEWGFKSLTFMFKYLSKLLVPDLRRTYDLMATLIGKHCQRPHISRFAAEALSFLLKKSCAPTYRGKPLNLILIHIKGDLSQMKNTKEFSLYCHGLMTMFAEAIKGHKNSIHTSGPTIFRSMIQVLDDKDLDPNEASPWINVLHGVLVCTLHHSDSNAFEGILNVIIDFFNQLKDSPNKLNDIQDLHKALLSAQMIGVCSGVRKGSRINCWIEIMRTLSQIQQFILEGFSKIATYDMNHDCFWNSLIFSISVAIQYAPFDSIADSILPLMEGITKEPFAKYFLIFCSYLSEAEPNRFRDVIIPYFQKFVIANWFNTANEDTLSILIPKMSNLGVLSHFSCKDGLLLPQSWQDEIALQFEQLEVSPFPEQVSSAVSEKNSRICHNRFLPKFNALLEVLECTEIHPSTNSKIAAILLRKLKLALRPSSSLAPEEANLIVCRGFSTFLKMKSKMGDVDCSLEPLLHAAAPRYIRLPNFLTALLNYKKSLKAFRLKNLAPILKRTEHEWDKALVTSLIRNLSTDSHILRLLSLKLLQEIHTCDSHELSEALSIMLIIEETPLNLKTARSASMLIRKLATLYPKLATDSSWLKDAIPSYCFGILTVKFAQLWEDACLSLKVIAETRQGEDFVSKLSISWLETPSMRINESDENIKSEKSQGLSDFECSNYTSIKILAKKAQTSNLNARDIMLQKFILAQESVLPQPSNARSQALLVLTNISAIAEKYSRQFVPLFLSWSCKVSEFSDELEADEELVLHEWSRKDQKSQLNLFSSFSNSKSLYKSTDVYASILSLLKNGDIEIQRSALKAIFTWKDPCVKPYEENLLNLLDESRFKEELGNFTNGQVSVKPDHRPTLMSLLLRILFGRSMSRKNGRLGIEARRKAIFRNLNIEDIENFINISLSNLKDLKLIKENKFQDDIFKKLDTAPRKQIGLIHMIEVAIKELGTQVSPLTEKLLNPILYCLLYSYRQLQGHHKKLNEVDEKTSSNLTILKAVRQNGMKCLIMLFSNSPNFDWSPYLCIINNYILYPKLVKLPEETAQGISPILKLFSVWSSHSNLAPFLAISDQIIPKVTECLVFTSSKNEVRSFALCILRNLIKTARQDLKNNIEKKSLVEKLLTPNMDILLSRISCVLQNFKNLGKEILEICIETTSELASFVTTSTQGRDLIDLSILLLEQPTRFVNPKMKSGLLLIMEQFIPLCNLHEYHDLKLRAYNILSSLFGYFKDRASREILSRVLMVYSKKDTDLGNISSLCLDLNSFIQDRLDDPDYERRLKAFNMINSHKDIPFTAYQWTPLVYNMLYYIKNEEEFGILSTNSSDGICQFISAAGRTTNELERSAFKQMLSKIILPALYSGIRESSEIIRREHLKVMAHLVSIFYDWNEVSDMYILLAGDNEVEASFFNNILAPEKGKQSSALGQLSAAVEKGELSSKNISQFFIPLIEQFIFNRGETNDAHSLASEAINTLGVLSTSINWPQYCAILRRYIGYIEQKPKFQKQIIRILGKIIDSLSSATIFPKKVENHVEIDINVPNVHQDIRGTLSATMPGQKKLVDDLTSFLPPLVKYLHDKDETTVSLRIPVAIIAVKLFKLLPPEKLNQSLPAVLTDVCHILKSKAQESRDMARDTLSKISLLLGPTYFGFILKELRGALSRGSQLHVLSFTLHSLLVTASSSYKPGDLDYCIQSIMAIIMDDIFGVVGKEKDADDYTSKMKEVKNHKSHDSIELVVKTITLARLKDLVHPIQVLLNEKLTINIVHKIDEVLNRISSGLMKNSAVASRDSLVFCYEIIQYVYSTEQGQEMIKEQHHIKKYIIQKGAKKTGERGSTTSYTYKMVCFALETLRSILRKYDHLRTSANMTGFIPILGDAIIRAEEEVKVSAFKLLTTIAKIHFKTPNESSNLYRIASNEAIKSFLASSSTSSEVSQAALKFISTIMRDRRDVTLKETSIDNILRRIQDDMTQFDRRHITFNFLRAVLDSKVETAVLYDTLDYIGTVMVINDDKETRDLSRGAYFHFLRDYPQKKNRWNKQLAFIVANLNYDREGGRLSILEVIHLLLSKSTPEFVQEVLATTFVPLVFVLANDESDKCRMAAGEILRTIFFKADFERSRTLLNLLRSWIKKDDNVSVIRLAFQVFKLFYESSNSNDNDLPLVLETILKTLQKTDDNCSNWEEIYFALQLILILTSKFPAILFSPKQRILWSLLPSCLSYPHERVKLSASKLFSIYFEDFARSNINNGLVGLPLKGSRGLELASSDVIVLVRAMLEIFKSPGLTQIIADEVVKNLVFLAKICSANNFKMLSNSPVNEKNIEEYDTEEEKQQFKERTVLQYLFSQLSYILRRETVPPRFLALVPKTSSLQLLTYLISSLSVDSIAPCLLSILLPLSNITDPSIPSPYSTDEAFRTGYENLKTSCIDIMESLRKKVGTRFYSETLVKIREDVKQKRAARCIKRKVEVLSMPEKYDVTKRKKLERKKARRRERGLEHAKRRKEY